MKKRLIITVGIMLLAALGFLSRKAGQFSDAQHAAFQNALWKLKHLDTVFNEDVLEARFGLMNNYDDFRTYAFQLRESLDALNQTPDFITVGGRAAIENSKKGYLDVLSKRDALLERFKSKNAVMANSSRYFPVAAQELASRLGGDPDSRQLETHVDGLVQLTLMRISNPDTSPEEAEAAFSKLNEWCAKHPAHPETKLALSLVRHARIISAGKNDLDDLIRQLLALPADDSIQKISLAYESEVSGALQRVRYYRMILYTVSSMMLIAILYVLWALRVANRNLETRVAERTKELATSEERFRTLCLAAPIGIQMLDAKGRCTYNNPAWQEISGLAPEECSGDGWLSAVHPEERRQIETKWIESVNGGLPFAREYRLLRSGKTRWVHSQIAPIHSTGGSVVGFVSASEDITARKDAEEKLEIAHRKLLETSHQAGMAEVATNVLHNVGNVLNSVNVSATLIADKVNASKIKSVAQLSDLIRKQEGNLAAYITTDPNGRQLPAYVERLAARLGEEQRELLSEIEIVRKNIEHIKDIVAMQQSYAKVSGVVEKVKVSDLIEDALRMNGGSLVRHDVEVVREYAPHVSDITVEKHKVLQVLVNLIRNAKYACDESGRKDKKLTMRLANGGDRVRISVVDNGIGIPEENMTKIFRHGFTTRKEGHGFGLHGSVLAAREMGGALIAQSDGLQRGAIFTLELPLKAPDAHNE